MARSTRKKRLLDAYRFRGFRPLDEIKGVFGDPHARVVTLTRRSKKRPAASVAAYTRAGTTGARGASATYRAGRTVQGPRGAHGLHPRWRPGAALVGTLVSAVLWWNLRKEL
jgi:hypothetical protein